VLFFLIVFLPMPKAFWEAFCAIEKIIADDCFQSHNRIALLQRQSDNEALTPRLRVAVDE
jgi:hypothetical protein